MSEFGEFSKLSCKLCNELCASEEISEKSSTDKLTIVYIDGKSYIFGSVSLIQSFLKLQVILFFFHLLTSIKVESPLSSEMEQSISNRSQKRTTASRT